MEKRRDIDHGWAWIVLGAAFLAQMLTTGHTQNSGTFFSIFLEAFQKPRSETMWIMAAQGTANSLAGALGGFLVSKYGGRTTLIIGGLIFGLSFSLLYFVQTLPQAVVCFGLGGIGIPLLLTGIIESTGQYFEKHLYLVMGFVASGAGIGTTLIGIEMEWALSTLGWRETMLVQSAIVLQICVGASLIYKNVIPREVKPINEKHAENGTVVATNTTTINNSSSHSEKQPMKTYWVDSRFILQTFGYVTFTAGRDITQYIMKDLYMSSMIVLYPYSYVVISFGVGSTIGRIMSGFATMAVTPPMCNVISTILCAGSIIVLLLSKSGIFLLIGVGFFGFFTGQQVVYQKLCWGTIFGREVMAALFGYSYMFTCIPRFGVPPIAGFIKDETGLYSLVILLATFFMLLSAASYFVAYLIHKRKSIASYTI